MKLRSRPELGKSGGDVPPPASPNVSQSQTQITGRLSELKVEDDDQRSCRRSVKDAKELDKQLKTVPCEKVYGAIATPVSRDHSYSRKLKQGAVEKLDMVQASEISDIPHVGVLHKKQLARLSVSSDAVVVSEVEKPVEAINVMKCEPVGTVFIACEVADKGQEGNLELADKDQEGNLELADRDQEGNLEVADNGQEETLELDDKDQGGNLEEVDEAQEGNLEMADKGQEENLVVSDKGQGDNLEMADKGQEDNPEMVDKGQEGNSDPETGDTNGNCEMETAVVIKSEPDEPEMEDNLIKHDEDGLAASPPCESKDHKKKVRRSTNGKASDQSSSSSTDDVPRRRSSRIRSLEEKKEKPKEAKPKKERTPKGAKTDTKRKSDIKTEKVESAPLGNDLKDSLLTEDHKNLSCSVKNDMRDDSSNGDTNSVASTDSFAPVTIVPIEHKVFASPNIDLKEEGTVRPEKVKSRWRRSSEMEQVCLPSLPVKVLPPLLEEDAAIQPPLVIAPPPVVLPIPLEKDSKPTLAVSVLPEPVIPLSPVEVTAMDNVADESDVPMQVDTVPEPNLLPQSVTPVPVVPPPALTIPAPVVAVTATPKPVPAVLVPVSPVLASVKSAPVVEKTEIPSLPPPPPPVKLTTVVQEPEVKCPAFESIDENIYLFDRRRSKSKKEVRRMLCDCTLLKEDKERGIMGCTQDCLNRLLMIECGSRCLLGEACSNKRFQRKDHAKTQPFKTDKKGWGLRATEDLPSGSFVMEYVGEVLSPLDFKQRVKHYAKGKNDHYYFMALKGDEIIDATVKGNFSRFINHSCSPNCETQKWTVNGELRIGFFSTREVKANEELTFDYQFQRYGREAQRCYCGSSNCRGFIGGDNQVPIKSSKTYVQKKQRSRRREVLEDLALEEEIEKLSGNGGLKNQEQTLLLARLMVRAEDHDTRQQLLDIIQHTTEQACLRLFLDYHGLSLLWSWMVDLSDDSSQLKTQILQILSLLPVPNKTMLLDSKVFNVVQRWATQPATSPVKTEVTEKGTSPVAAEKSVTEADLPQKEICLNSENFIIDDLDSIPLPPMPPPPPVKKEKNTTQEKCERDVESENGDSKMPKLPGCIVFDPLEGSSSTEDSTERSTGDTVRETTPPEEGKKTEENAPNKSSDSDESHDAAEEDEGGQKMDISALAAKMLDAWSGLKEVFRIPRVEQEKRKEDERAAAQQASAEWEAGSPRHKMDSSPSSRSRKRHKEEPPERRFNIRSPLLPTPPKMSKEERRQLFAMEVQQRDQEEAFRRQQMTSTPEFPSQVPYMFDMAGYPTMAFDPNIGYTPIDPNTGFPLPLPQIDPNTGFPLPPPQIDPNTGFPLPPPQIDPNTGFAIPPTPVDPMTGFPLPPEQYQLSAIDPNTGYPLPPNDPGAGYQLQATPIDPNTGYPLQAIQVDPNTGYPLQATVRVDPNTGYTIQAAPAEAGYSLQHEVEPNPAFSAQIPTSSVPADESPMSSVVTSSAPPVYAGNPGQTQIFQQATPSYPPSTTQVSYMPGTVTTSHVTTTSAVTPLLPGPVVTVAAFHAQVASPSVATNSPQVASSPSVAVVPASPVIPAATSIAGFVPPAQPFLATASTPQLYYVQSTGAVVSIPPEQSLAASVPSTLVHVAVAPPAVEELPAPPPKTTKVSTKLPPNWKTAKDEEGNLYYYHSITRETQWDPPSMEEDEEEEVESMDLGTPTFDEPKVGIRIKHHASSSSSSKKKTTTAAADTSSEVAKKIKELFRSKMSGYIVQCLNPYRKPDCKLGHISNTEDFKHLARKLTHFVMSKELKYCKNVEDLECNENVKHKAKEFVHKYMSKYGAEYRKDKHGSPGI